MNEIQRTALENSVKPFFTEEDAKHVLNWFVGSAPIRRILGNVVNVGVAKAVEKLGGRIGQGNVVICLPNYHPIDEV